MGYVVQEEDLQTGAVTRRTAITKRASSRAAILRFTFPKGAKRRIVFDASRFFMSCFAIDRPQVGGIRFGADGRSVVAWNPDRCEHAFLTLAAPERVDGMMRSLLQNYREGGWLPKWPNLTYTGEMMGDPASMILAEAYVKGFRGFDVNLAYEAAWKSATVPAHNDVGNNWKGRIPWRGYPCVRCGLTRYMEKGWVAADECFESVTRTQDFGLNDLAVAVLAEATGHADEAAYLRKRSRNYRYVWNKDRKLFWPRHASGRWKPFWNGESGHGDYCIVKSVKLNGVELKDRRIRHSDIVKGGLLEFEMSDK